MLSYLSSKEGIGGKIKSIPADFIVEEISQDGQIFEINKKPILIDSNGNFIHVVLQKENWTTNSAISQIAKSLRLNVRNFSFAGNKDKFAITTGLCSVSNCSKEPLLNLKIKDLKILAAATRPSRVQLGDLLGNRFTIKVRDISTNPHLQVAQIFSELIGFFPNYFGPQRFGSTRKNTYSVGFNLLKKDCQTAVMEILCNTAGEENSQTILARKELAESQNFKAALHFFPKYLHLERNLLDSLSKKPDDFKGALKKLPNNVLLLFINCVQSKIFNDLLSQRLSEGHLDLEEGEFFCGSDSFGFPNLDSIVAEGFHVGKIIGYQTVLNKREKDHLDSQEISKEEFRMPDFPQLHSKGSRRLLLAPLINFSFSADTFRFSLPSGSYATSALREFLDKKSNTNNSILGELELDT